jgi:tetrahydromethanopterin S-methyltransferase subunit G
MTMPIKFDTLEYVQSLIEAGMPADQAEAQASALTQALDEATVAPGELVLLRTDMLARIEMLRIEMYAKLDALQEYISLKLDALKQYINTKVDALEQYINLKFDALEQHVNAKLEALEQRLRAYIDRKLSTLYWLVGISLAMQTVTLGLLLRVIDRLP